MATHTLIVPFLTDDPEFARGVEFGMLYLRMSHKIDDAIVDIIDELFLLSNQEQILLLANRLGWSVKNVEGPIERDWFRIRMHRLG